MVHDSISFEDDSAVQPTLPPVVPEVATLHKGLVKMNFANSLTEASILLALVASLLFAGMIYFIVAAIPSPTTLGPDQFRAGEVPPDYIAQPESSL